MTDEDARVEAARRWPHDGVRRYAFVEGAKSGRAAVLAEVRAGIEAIPIQHATEMATSRFGRDVKADALAVLDRAASETGEER